MKVNCIWTFYHCVKWYLIHREGWLRPEDSTEYRFLWKMKSWLPLVGVRRGRIFVGEAWSGLWGKGHCKSLGEMVLQIAVCGRSCFLRRWQQYLSFHVLLWNVTLSLTSQEYKFIFLFLESFQSPCIYFWPIKFSRSNAVEFPSLCAKKSSAFTFISWNSPFSVTQLPCCEE